MLKFKSVFIVIVVALVFTTQLYGQFPDQSGAAPSDAAGGRGMGNRGQMPQGMGPGMMGGPGMRGGPGGFGGGAQTVDFNDFEGFNQIFDGETFNGWDVATEIWSIEDGAMVATSTQENPAGTTFAIWEGGEVANFELKLEFKIEGGGNGGVQYRSWRNPNPSMGGFGGARGGNAAAGDRGMMGARGGDAAGSDVAVGGRGQGPDIGGDVEAGGRGMMMAGRGGEMPQGMGQRGDARGARGGPGGGMGGGAYSAWNVAGYQADISGNMTGQLFEGGRFAGERGITTSAGQVMVLEPNDQKTLLATLGTSQEVLSTYEDGQWNQYHIIADGNVLMHIVNGRLVSVTIDRNPEKQKDSGIIALQIEGSGITMSYRNIWLKNLE